VARVAAVTPAFHGPYSCLQFLNTIEKIEGERHTGQVELQIPLEADGGARPADAVGGKPPAAPARARRFEDPLLDQGGHGLHR